MVVNMYKHMGKVVIKILQSSAVTQTALGGLTIYLPVANFLWCIFAKNYANWLAVDKVIAKTKRVPVFFKAQCIYVYTCIKESIFVHRPDGVCNMWNVTCLLTLQLL